MTAGGNGTKDDSWVLKTPPGSSEYTMHKDEEADPQLLMCQVGSTWLSYQLRCIEDASGCTCRRSWRRWALSN